MNSKTGMENESGSVVPESGVLADLHLAEHARFDATFAKYRALIHVSAREYESLDDCLEDTQPAL